MTVNKIEQESPNLMDLILGHKIDLVIDTPPQGADHSRDGFVIRRNAIETGVNVLTAIDTAKALITLSLIHIYKGTMLNNSFMQYKIPSRRDMGNIQVEFESSFEPTGPFGAKSIGEIVINTRCV